jgi:hypothetical protein
MRTAFFLDLIDPEGFGWRAFSLLPVLPPAPGLRLVIFTFQGYKMIATISLN